MSFEKMSESKPSDDTSSRFKELSKLEPLDSSRKMPRERGTPQGGVVSPIVMNLFMHYAFDVWM